MIDMEKVIKGMEQFRADLKPFCGNHADWERFDAGLSMLKEQEAVEPNEWIKCSDEMPKEQETIFAKFKGTDKWSPAMFAQSSEDVRVFIVFADGTRRVSHSHTIDGKWECEKSPLKRTVTHWMPNPKLPKEDW